MNVVPVCCQNCGASLEIGEAARYVTCQFCHSQLSVQHTGTAIFTELLGDLAQRTDRMAEELENLRLQNQIHQVERDWQTEREGFLIQTRRGGKREPSVGTSWFSGLFLIGIGFWIGATMLTSSGDSSHSSDGSNGNLIVPLVAIVGGIFTIVHGLSKAEKFEKARAEYENRRQELEKKLK